MEDTCNKQIYLQFRLGSSQVIGLIDTGSDVSIVSESYLKLYVPNYRQLDAATAESTVVRTFTGTKVTLLGIYKLPICVSQVKFEMYFHVTDTETYSVKLIIGRDMLMAMEASIIYKELNVVSEDSCDEHSFTLRLDKGRQAQVQLMHIAVPGLFAVQAVGSQRIESRKSAYITFRLHYNPFIGPGDEILISNSNRAIDRSTLYIHETTSQPTLTKSGEVLGTALVHNLSRRDLRVTNLEGILEILPAGTFKCTEITHKSRKAVIRSLVKTGLSQLILPGLSDNDMKVDRSRSAAYYESLGAKPKQTGRIILDSPINRVLNYRTNCTQPEVLESKAVFEHSKSMEPRQVIAMSKTLHCFSISNQNEIHNYLEDDQTSADFALGLLDETSGPTLSVPPDTDRKIHELVDLDRHEENIRPYIEDIFINKYPSVVGRHNLDAGQLRYLGKVILRTKPGMTLPKHRRLYALDERSQSHLTDIVDFLLKYDIIRETFQDSPENQSSPWGALGHLVSRKTRPGEPNEGQTSMARIVINYRDNLNSIILPTPSLVTSIETCIEKLRKGYFFSILDLKQSYFGLTLAPESEGLTQFLVPPGNSYCFKRVPMGLTSAPASLLEKLNIVFNYQPKTDKDGNVILKPGQDKKDVTSLAELEYQPLHCVINFYDDILIQTEKVPNDDAENSLSREKHFQDVERVAKRMATFDLRTSFHKCSFCVREILFLGWLISDGQVRADPKRLEKVKEFKFPENRRDLQSFLGLINTMRRVTPLTAGKYLAGLSELSSSKEKFTPSEYHKQCFEGLKEQLTGTEIICSLMDPEADKIIFTDASNVAYGSVLLERIPDSSTENLPLQKSHIPEESLDTLDCVLRRWGLSYVRRELNGHIGDSFYEALIYIARQNQLHKIPKDLVELKSEIVKFLRRDSLGEQVKEILFKGNRKRFLEFLYSHIQALRESITPQSVVLEAVAKLYNRGLIVVHDSLTESKPPITQIVGGVNKTCQPIKLGYYEKERRFVPLCDALDFEFDSKLLNSKFRVCYYDCKLINREHRNRTILEHEATALLIALKKYETHIRSCRTYLVIDNRSLYYLFSPAIVSNHVKINRFQLKLMSDYPTCRILWCSTKENIADLFTRFGLQKEYEQRIKYEDFKITSMPTLPNNCILTWTNWGEIVEKHPKCMELLVNLDKTYGTKSKVRLEQLKSVYDGNDRSNANDQGSGININDEPQVDSSSKVSLAIRKHPTADAQTDPFTQPFKSKCTHYSKFQKPEGPTQRVYHLYVNNVTLLTAPMDCLRDKLSFSNIRSAQKRECKEILDKLIGQDGFVKHNNYYFKTFEGVLYASKEPKGDKKVIYLPKSLEPTALALIHLRQGHLGAKGLARELSEDYRFESSNFTDMCKNFVGNCFHCFINSNSSRKIALGTLTLGDINVPFSAVILDLAEDLYPTRRKHIHLLLYKCILTQYVIILPLRTKTSGEIYFNLLTYVIPITGVPKLLISDNGNAFRGKDLVSMLTAIRIKVLVSPALKPEARGLIERNVGVVKESLRRLVSIQNLKTIQMDVLCTLVMLYYNNTWNKRVNNYPSYLAFGRTTLDTSVFSADSAVLKQHPFLLKSHKLAQQNQAEMIQMYEKVKQEIQMVQQSYSNTVKKPVNKNLGQGDIVYLKKYEKPQGVKTTLYPTYSPEAFVIISTTKTYVVIQRISDGFLTVRSQNDVKKFKQSHIMDTLPEQVQSHLRENFLDLDQEQINEIVRNSQLQLLEGQIPEQSWIELEELADPEFFVISDVDDGVEVQPDIAEGQEKEQLLPGKVDSNDSPENQDDDSSDDEGEGSKDLRTRKVTFKL